MKMFVLVFVSILGLGTINAEAVHHPWKEGNEYQRILRKTLMVKDAASKRIKTQEDDVQRRIEQLLSKEQNIVKDVAALDRRDAIQLAKMVETTTGTSPTKYLSYGCYCGFGGEGDPVDAIDRCCQMHDRCYGQLTANFGCHEWWRYLNSYEWHLGTNGDIVCLPNGNKCKKGQCLCDKLMAECFQEHHSVYNEKYTGFWWTLFGRC